MFEFIIGLGFDGFIFFCKILGIGIVFTVYTDTWGGDIQFKSPAGLLLIKADTLP